MEDLKKLLAEATPGPWINWNARISTAYSSRDPLDDGDPLAIADCDMDTRIDYDTVASANAALICAAVNALPELLAEVEVLRRLAPEYFQWAGKSGADAAPEWLQDRLKYGSASVDGDMLAVYDWHGRRSLAAPGDYVVHGEEWLWVLPARAALKEPAQ